MYLVSTPPPSQSSTMTPPYQKVTHSLDNDIHELLGRHDISEYDKLSMYQELLNRYLKYYNKAVGEDTPSLAHDKVLPTREYMMDGDSNIGTENHSDSKIGGEEESANVVEEILKSVPTSGVKHARLLLKKIKEKPDIISWNSNSEIVVNGKVIPKSNIHDVIYDAVSQKKTPPIGYDVFYKALDDINTPRSYILNKNRISSKSHDTPESPLSVKKKKKKTDARSLPLRLKKKRVSSLATRHLWHPL